MTPQPNKGGRFALEAAGESAGKRRRRRRKVETESRAVTHDVSSLIGVRVAASFLRIRFVDSPRAQTAHFSFIPVLISADLRLGGGTDELEGWGGVCDDNETSGVLLLQTDSSDRRAG